MSEIIKILSYGDMDSTVDAALAERFQILRDDGDGFKALIAAHGPEIRGLVTRGRRAVTAALIDRLPRLEMIGNFGVGYDSVDVAAAARRGIVVTNTPDVLNDEMGDFTVGLLLATIRRIPQADRYVREHRWQPNENFPLGPSLRNRTIGIAGMGRIGKTIARRLEGFDLPVSAYVRRPRPDLSAYRLHETMLDLARAVDTLIVVLPGGAETRHAVDAEVLKALGPEGVLINVARGSVVDEQALIAALRDGTILAAGLDVFAVEPGVPEALKQMDHVVLLPHIGTATLHTRGLMAQLVVDNVTSWFEGKGALTPVPETPQPGPMVETSGGTKVAPSVTGHVVPAPPLVTVPVTGGGEFPVRRVFCVGRNYAAHARELGNDERDPPFFFTKPADALVTRGADTPYPSATANLHHEVELVVAIGRGGKDIDTAAALDHVFGYAVGIDLTRRDLQDEAKAARRPWDMSKGFDASGPVGEIVPARSAGHPAGGEIVLTVNAEPRQRGDLSDQIWPVPDVIAALSRLVALAAGDLIFTGTPKGVAAVSRGDTLRGEIATVGSVQTRIV